MTERKSILDEIENSQKALWARQEADPDGEIWPRRSWDDVGNAARLLQHSRGRLRWVADTGIWSRYQGNRWSMDKNAGNVSAQAMVVHVYAKEIAVYDSEPDAKGRSEQDKFRDWSTSQRNVGPIQAAAKALQFTEAVNCLSTDFDADPMLFNAANGVIDLRSGGIFDHDPTLLLSQASDVSYEPDAAWPRWQAFLDRVMPDPEMQRYLQRIVGYTMTAARTEQAMFIHHGETANGKSVFLQVLEAVMGEYAQVVPPNSLVATQNEKHPTDINRMQNKRFLQMSETAKGARLDEALVKRLTGQETVTARAMGQDFHDFRIVGKIHMVTNHLPHLTASDPAVLRRIRPVHWAVTIPEEERDGDLADTIIREESTGVLNWAVRGCLAWQKEGLGVPEVARMDAAAYIAGEDELGLWMEERTMPAAERWERADVLYADYRAWAETGAIKPMTVTAWGREMKIRKIEKKRAASGMQYALVRANFDHLRAATDL